jgi:hypothetical protein
VVLTLAVLPLSACGGGRDDTATAAAETAAEAGRAPDTCVATAKPTAAPPSSVFPAGWPMPPSTVVTGSVPRDTGVIVTAVTATSLGDVLAFLNGRVAGAGFTVTSGETEEHDAEADWAGNGFHGRWAIRESSACRGETVLQIFSAPQH